ncbi:MAG: hypothetical protein ACNA7U_03830 [Candidatus Izemoplasmataceae bacterium]
MTKTKTTKKVDKLEEIVTDENVIEEVNITKEELEPKEIIEDVKEESPPHVDVKPDPIKKQKVLGIKKGTVVNCNALRIREGANIKTRQLAILQVGSSVDVNLDNSTESFYEVTASVDTSFVIGYCLKDYISLGK